MKFVNVWPALCGIGVFGAGFALKTLFDGLAPVPYDIVEDRRRVTDDDQRFVSDVCFDCMRTARSGSDQRSCLQQRVMLCRSAGYSSASQLPGGLDLPGAPKDQGRMGTFVSCSCDGEAK